MARTHAKGCDIFVDQYDFSGISNSVDISIANGVADVTAFSDASLTYVEGKPKTSITLNALYQTTEDAAMFADLGSATDNYLSISPIAMAEGGIVWVTKAQCTADVIPAPVGDAVALNTTWVGTDPIGDGIILLRRTAHLGSLIATGTGYQVGAVSATQKIVATLHVIGVTNGTTLDVTVESDATDAWIGAETTRLTFTQVTTSATVEIKNANGAITDTWWRSVGVAGGTDTDIYNYLVTFAIIPL